MTEALALRPRLLDVRDVMSACHVGRHAAFALMARAGRVKWGRSVRVRPEDLDRVLEELREEGATT